MNSANSISKFLANLNIYDYTIYVYKYLYVYYKLIHIFICVNIPDYYC